MAAARGVGRVRKAVVVRVRHRRRSGTVTPSERDATHVEAERLERYRRELEARERELTRASDLLAAERKRLVESEARFRTMADCAPVMLWMSGTDGLWHFFNQGWMDFSGRPLEEELGTGWAEGVHAEDIQRCMTTYLEAFAERRPFRMEYRLRRKDGEYRWILDQGKPRWNRPRGGGDAEGADGEFAGYIGSCIDITEQQTLQAELDTRVRERTAELLAANQELEAFSYSVSHDLRAPLRSVDGFCTALLEDYGPRLDAEGRHFLERARAGTQRMATLIDDLLDLSRVTRASIRRDAIELDVLADGIVTDLRGLNPDRAVTVEITPGLRAHGDRHLISLLLVNLLGNAWKFTSKRPDARISVGVESRDGDAAFFVRDNGAGFDMSRAERLFAPFTRLHEPSDFEGTGIGLATVQRIVRRHGGRVWVDAAVGQGATVFFTLGRTPEVPPA